MPVLVALAALAGACAGPRRSPSTLDARSEPPAPTASEAPAVTVQRARPVPTGRGGPPPVPNGMNPDVERQGEAARKRWREAMHRAAPGTDWRAIERANGEQLMQRRADLLARKDYTADTWTERGSRNQAGRMHSVAIGLDGTTLYGGSSHGGAWRGDVDGTTWTPIADNLFGGAHHVIVTSSAAGETVLALMDWGRLRYTTDQGASWLAPAGLPGDVDRGVRLLADPVVRTRAFVLVGRRGGTRSVYRSDDGGLSWTPVRALAAGYGDMWMDRVAGGTLYVLDGTELWSGTPTGTWRSEGIVTGSAVDDVRLAGSEAGSPTFYAAVHPPGGTWQLHRSNNGGRTWTYQRDIPDFWGTLCASITDPLLVATGGMEVFRSANGGSTATLVNPWWEYYGDPAGRLHADVPGIHCLLVAGSEAWFVSTDGGLFRSDDGLLSVRNLSLQHLGVSQYYTTLTSRRDPSRILAGAQDQGYQRSGGGTPGGLLDFAQLISGDYGHLTSSDRTHAWVYSVYPGFVLVHEGEDVPQLSTLDFPAGEQLQWMPVVVADPLNQQAFYLCGRHLWRYERDAGGAWTSAQATAQDFTTSGGWALTALGFAPTDAQRAIAVTDTGVVWTSVDGGANWTISPDRGPASHYFYGTAIVHSPVDPLVAYLGGAGYSGPAVYRTIDGGSRWTPVASGLPSTLVYGLAWEADDSQVIYAATEAGPYRLDPATDTWEYLGGTVAPLTTYWSVESVPEVGVIRFGTYGRGIWDWQARVVPEAGHCADGVDNEADGLADCADPDCALDAACREDCTNGVDDEGDGFVDCADDECRTSDTDGDGHLDCDECAPQDAGAWATPGEVTELRAAKPDPTGGTVRLSWSGDARAAAGDGTRHDIASGDIDALRAAGWPAAAACVGDDVVPLETDDAAPPGGRWYLVRADNACGNGPWGGAAQPSPDCP